MGRKKNKRKARAKQKRWSNPISPRSMKNPERVEKSRKAKQKQKQPRETKVKLTTLTDEYLFNTYKNYTPQSVRASLKKSTMSETLSAMKKEYSRLRPTAMKRLERLSKSQFKSSNVYQYYKDRFAKLSSIKDSDVASALAEVNRFLASDLSTIKGQQKQLEQNIKKLKSYNYEIDENTAPMIFDLMEYIRTNHYDLMYDSAQVMELVTDIVHDLYKATPNFSFSDFSVSELGEFVNALYEVDSGATWNVPEL